MTQENKKSPKPVDPSDKQSSPNYAGRRLFALGLGTFVVTAVLTGVAYVSNHTTDLHEPQMITIDNKDSDGTKLDSHTAALEDIMNEALKQADDLGIEDSRTRTDIAASVDDATDAAIEAEVDGSLVGNKVQVTLVKDFFDEPKVAIVRKG